MVGTDFPESVKLEARKRAAFKCCYCRERMGDEVHHLVPKEQDGHGVIENAILLCAQCHSDYGNNPCIKGTRITVYDVLNYPGGGTTEDAILSDFPDLTRDDIRAALAFEHPQEVRAGSSLETPRRHHRRAAPSPRGLRQGARLRCPPNRGHDPSTRRRGSRGRHSRVAQTDGASKKA